MILPEGDPDVTCPEPVNPLVASFRGRDAQNKLGPKDLRHLSADSAIPEGQFGFGSAGLKILIQ
ncbi:MAG TPA: hypothetical protein VKP30_17780 [Polyangiaceae bacterium]|nr:hypothetical protein [Polyangiaceae bacterium]